MKNLELEKNLIGIEQKKIKFQKIIKLNNLDFETLKNGKHLCLNYISSFITLKVINIETDEFLFAEVNQIRGIPNYTCAIQKINC